MQNQYITTKMNPLRRQEVREDATQIRKNAAAPASLTHNL
jgi:hypothetical protein